MDYKKTFDKNSLESIEVMWLEELAKDEVYEFVFIATALNWEARPHRRSNLGTSHSAVKARKRGNHGESFGGSRVVD
jgi:hypothetical protein